MTWRDDLNFGLAAFGLRLPDQLPLDDWAARLSRAPMRDTAVLVAGSAAAFLAAERGHNPKVRDIYDALVYCSTCLSVGYADIFPRTPVGKLIGTALMTVGPSLAARATDGRPSPAEQADRDAVQQQILATLQDIAAKLHAPTAAAVGAEDNAPPSPPGRGRG